MVRSSSATFLSELPILEPRENPLLDFTGEEDVRYDINTLASNLMCICILLGFCHLSLLGPHQSQVEVSVNIVGLEELFLYLQTVGAPTSFVPRPPSLKVLNYIIK